MIAILAKNMKCYAAHLATHGLKADGCFWANSFEAVRRYRITAVRVDASCEGDPSQLKILELARAKVER